jgi:hypothetical protein
MFPADDAFKQDTLAFYRGRFIDEFVGSARQHDTNLCNVMPEKAVPGDPPGVLRIAPGDPSLSVVSMRMHSLDPMFRMPQIGTRVVDTEGVAMIDAFVTSLTDCPN